jgi:hypothetical protein
MKRLLAPLTTVLLSIGACACGNAGTQRNSASAASTAIPVLRFLGGDYDKDDYYSHESDADNDDIKTSRDKDNDSDNKGNSYYDSDDKVIRAFGRAADAAERRTIMALIKRDFAVAATEDGQTACSMIAANIAKGVPETLGRPPGPPYLQGTTCAVIMSKVFKQNHQQLAIYAATLEVTGVRVDGSRGLVVLRFRTLPGREIAIVRESGAWKLGVLIDRELP